MISIRLGNPGSGKSAVAVREMMRNPALRTTYTNIRTKIPSCKLINSSMIIKKEQIGVRRNGEPVFDLKLNVEFWQNIKEPINVVIDEAHSLMNARRSMSKPNILMTDWLALIRRVLGTAESGYGELVLIDQLHNRVDVIAREMATNIRYHVCHYRKTCIKCGISWDETSETPEPLWSCPSCGGARVKKHQHTVEVWHFASMQSYLGWKQMGMNTFHAHYMIDDIEEYFGLYNSLQWENMFSDIYE